MFVNPVVINKGVIPMSMDHITLPKTTLMQFSESGRFHYLDVKTNQIFSASAASYNTRENFYPEEKENFLSSQIETVIGRLRKMLVDFKDINDKIQLPITIKEDVIRCLAIQVARMPNFVSDIHSQSEFAEILHIPEEYFSPLHREGDKLINMAIERYQSLLSDYDVNVCVIEKQRPFSFILPTSHHLSTGKNIIFVLSPCRAIMLLPAKDNEKYYSPEGDLGYLDFQTYTDLIPLYKKTIQAEQKNKEGRIIGLKNQLELLKELNE